MAIVKQNDVSTLIEGWLKDEAEGNKFPVPFDIAWTIAGYSAKYSGKRNLPKGTNDEAFYIVYNTEKDKAGRPAEQIYLSIKGFVLFLLSSSRRDEAKKLIWQIICAATGMRGNYFQGKGGDPSGFVYLVRASVTNYYKIGKSKDVYKRLQTLQTGTPLELVVVCRVFSTDCTALESALHDYYSAYWIRGEWFDFPASVANEFYKVANDLENEREEATIEPLKLAEARQVVSRYKL